MISDCAIYCLTVSGIKFNPMEPSWDVIILDDIAHALSLSCRFAGQINFHYSIAEHSINCMEYVDHVFKNKNHPFLKQFNISNTKFKKDILMYHALMHDASEAYLTDIPKPLKIHLPVYQEIETKWENVIQDTFNMPVLNDEEKRFIKAVDYLMFMYECKSLWQNMPEEGILYRNKVVEGHWQNWFNFKGPIQESISMYDVKAKFYKLVYNFYI